MSGKKPTHLNTLSIVLRQMLHKSHSRHLLCIDFQVRNNKSVTVCLAGVINEATYGTCWEPEGNRAEFSSGRHCPILH
ncbi:MAG: hypothetical protein U0T36_10955 [Saprospiraceae bacterium]